MRRPVGHQEWLRGHGGLEGECVCGVIVTAFPEWSLAKEPPLSMSCEEWSRLSEMVKLNTCGPHDPVIVRVNRFVA